MSDLCSADIQFSKNLKNLIATQSQLRFIRSEEMITDITTKTKTSNAMTLSKAGAGRQMRISELVGGACQRLREIGFCEQMEISKISDGRNMICSVCGTRLALSRKLGDQVLVEMV